MKARSSEPRSPAEPPPVDIHPAMFKIARLLARVAVAEHNAATPTEPTNDNTLDRHLRPL